jgi:hypothetical protein
MKEIIYFKTNLRFLNGNCLLGRRSSRKWDDNSKCILQTIHEAVGWIRLVIASEPWLNLVVMAVHLRIL